MTTVPLVSIDMQLGKVRRYIRDAGTGKPIRTHEFEFSPVESAQIQAGLAIICRHQVEMVRTRGAV